MKWAKQNYGKRHKPAAESLATLKAAFACK